LPDRRFPPGFPAVVASQLKQKAQIVCCHLTHKESISAFAVSLDVQTWLIFLMLVKKLLASLSNAHDSISRAPARVIANNGQIVGVGCPSPARAM
jgi:hypothetical protein